MDIRYLTDTDDRLAVSHIYEESWKCAYKGIVPQAYLDSLSNGQWAGALDADGRHTLVVVEDGQLVGVSGFGRARTAETAGFGEVYSLYLLPQYMGRGYGARLLQTAVEELRKQGFSQVILWVLADNQRARRFYEKNGFVKSNLQKEITISGKQLRELAYIFRFGRTLP